MALLIGSIALATKLQTNGGGGGQSSAAPRCLGHHSGDGWPLWQAKSGAECATSDHVAFVCPIFIHEPLLPVFLLSEKFRSQPLPKSQPAVSVCFVCFPSHLTAGIEGHIFRRSWLRSHADMCLRCGVLLIYWHVKVGTCVSKRLLWSLLPRKSPGT